MARDLVTTVWWKLLSMIIRLGKCQSWKLRSGTDARRALLQPCTKLLAADTHRPRSCFGQALVWLANDSPGGNPFREFFCPRRAGFLHCSSPRAKVSLQ